MKYVRKIFGCLLATSMGCLMADPARAQEKERIVALGGAVTEIVCALGEGDQLVAVDSSSTFPESVRQLPQVGYYRMLSAEGVLALHPDLLLASEEAGPPEAMDQIQRAGVKVTRIPAAHDIAGCESRIRALGKALGHEADAETMWSGISSVLEKLVSETPATPPARVLFVYARGAGTLNIAGEKTSAHEMIRLAGGQNAVSGFEGYRPVTAESVVTAAPDVILVTTSGLESIGGVDGLLNLPGMKDTPAGVQRRVVALDDLYLLGFGPRVAAAVRDLRGLIKL